MEKKIIALTVKDADGESVTLGAELADLPTSGYKLEAQEGAGTTSGWQICRIWSKT